MRKVYITNIPLQGRGKLLKVLYRPRGTELKHNRETSFPIIPVIQEHREEGDETTVLAVRSNNKDTPDNYAAFLEELAALGIGGDQVEEISVEENQSESVSLALMMKILEEIPDDSIIYADISFGTKPMSAILLYAMSFVEKMKNCEVDGIYYGEIQRRDGKVADTGFYDLTMFKLLGNVIDQMKNLGISDMQAALNKLIRP